MKNPTLISRKWPVCKGIFIAWLLSLTGSSNTLLAEGSKEFKPDSTKTSSIMILNTSSSYGTFASYSAGDTNRLFIRINNPATEKIYFGIGQRSSNTNYYFRIKNPNGVVIAGPTLLPTAAGQQGYIAYNKQAINGPDVVNPLGYNGFSITPTAGLPGNYYIEFNQGHANNEAFNTEISFGIFDITVVNTGLPNTAIPGRVFSYNWSFNTDSYSNPFYGSFYIYGSDSSVTMVNMNGIKPYKFRASCNSWGCQNTGNATNDRKSRLGFYVPPELKLFLRDPDLIAFPSGSLQFLNAPISLSRCVKDSLCINVNLTKKSDVTIVIDRNGNGVFNPGTTDRKLFFPGTLAGPNCLHWNGKDGLGNYIAPGTSLSIIASVESGEVNFPMFDIENHENGFSMSVIRPGSGLAVDSLFYDDISLGGNANLTGCAFPCHTWVSNPANTDKSYGNDNTVNTWWFAHKQSVTSNLTMPDYLVTTAGADQSKCAQGSNKDTILISGGIAYSTAVYNGSKKWWSSGSGTFSPNDTLYGTKYIPSTADINNGTVMLFLAPRLNCNTPIDTVIVTLKKVPALSTTTGNVNCFSQATGSVNLTVNNSQSPYTYNWSNASTMQNLTGATAGTYTVTVTSANGCTATTSAVITQTATALSASASTVTPVSCFGGNNGSISLTVNGGTGPYGYQWSNGATFQNISNIQTGNYTVTVTDTKGCTTSISAVTISSPAAALNPGVTSKTDVACNGGNSGSVNLTVTGGTAPYSYLWSNGMTTQQLSGVTAGNYSVNVTDQNGCSAAVSGIVIAQPAASLNAATNSLTNISCFGEATGQINLNVTGGTAPYTYAWSNGNLTQNLNNVTAGAYTVTVTDANGCTFISSAISLSQPGAVLFGSATTTANVSCSSGANGAISLNVSGGTAPYTYAWSNGATTQSISSLYAGHYVVTITDNKGCSASSSSDVTQPAGSLNSTINSSQEVNCYGGSNGSVDLAVSGGTPPYQYQWNNGETTQDLSNLSAGSYTVIITDENGCINMSAAVITQPSAALNTAITSQSAVSCFGGNNGSIDLTINGGSAPYTINWSNGSSAEDQFSLAAGNYTVTVTDTKGCTVSNAALTISGPAAELHAALNSSVNVSCFSGTNGSLNLNTSGGTSPYSYNWSNGATTSSAGSLSAGSYTVTVTDDNGCTQVLNGLTVAQPPAPLAASATSQNAVSCFGGSNGSINLGVSGGTATYTYQWSNGATTQNLTGLQAGTYTATITDANGCTEVATGISISQPAAALSSAVASTNNVSCNGGTNGNLLLNVSGGTAPYNFQWSNAATTQNLNNVISGNYAVTITDSKGCTTAKSGLIISQPAAVLAGNVASSNEVSCFGGNNGAINLTVTGGTSPYTYAWNNGAQSQNISGLATGIYAVSITDANGCTTAVSGVAVTQPAASLAGTVSSITPVSCFGNSTGSISLNVSGGTAPYTYAWSNGATVQNISGIVSGTYNVSVTDQNGCTDFVSGILIEQPAAVLNANVLASTDASCYGNNTGSILLNVNGGTAPYQYTWSNGTHLQNLLNATAGTYAVSITDDNGCTFNISGQTISQPAAPLNGSVSQSTNVSCYGNNTGAITLAVNGGTAPYSYQWSNGAVTQSLTNIAAGNYAVTVTDNNGCTVGVAAVSISQPAAALNGTASTTQNVSCNSGANGTINLTVTGGTSPYAYQWSNGATTQDLNSLFSGTYAVSITDSQGCQFAASATVSQPAGALSTAINVAQQVDCYGNNNGSIVLSAAGGTAPYAFQWSNGETIQNISGLAAGSYMATITDANGCINMASAIVGQPAAALSAGTSATGDVNCFGGTNGAISLQVNGGTTPYQFVWSNGETVQDITNLTSGTYTVSVTDLNGCKTIVPGIIISQPAAALNGNISATTAVNCFSGNDGAISITVNGGTAPYAYQWSNGANTPVITNLAAGFYDVTVTDFNGCVTSLSGITVTEPAAALSGNASTVTNVGCFGGSNGAIGLTITGGTMPYTYQWSTGESTQQITNLLPGSYIATVTDGNGCVAQLSGIAISQPSAPLATAVSLLQNVDCYGGVDGWVDLTVTGGTPVYTYNWTNGATTEDVNNLSSGTYTVYITDANGCMDSTFAKVNQPDTLLSASMVIHQIISCNNGSNGMIKITVSGGTYPYTYLWSNGCTTATNPNLPTGIYTVVVTDSKGCTLSGTQNLTQPATPLVSAINVTQPVSCHGGNDGSADFTVSGGVPPYIYSWSNGSTKQAAGGLATGTYTVIVTDAAGCTQVGTAVITQPAGALAATPLVSSQVNCFGNNNGSINLTVQFGTAPYTFAWSNGMTTEDLSGLTAGSYTVTVADANGCTKIVSATVSQPSATLAVSGTGIASNCLSGVLGSVHLAVSGGTAPFTYQWNTGATTQHLNNLVAGSYTVSITDSKGCTAIGSYQITDNSSFQAGANGPTDICMGDLLTMSADSFPNIHYQWYMNGQAVNGANGYSFTTPASGSYFVVLSSDCGNYTSQPIVVTVHQVGNVTTSANAIICPKEFQTAQLNATGGISYEWTPSNGLNNPLIANPVANPTHTTIYTVTITGDFGCKKTATVEVGVVCDTLFIPNGFSPNNDGINDGFTIVGIDKYPGNKIWIYNRWGNLIYKKHDYDNKWNGDSNVPGLYIGKKVPAGTYYYLLDLNNNSKPKQGYIIMRY